MTITSRRPRVKQLDQQSGNWAQRKRRFEMGVYIFFGLYALITLAPFYMLFIRTFVGTDEATNLHLWLPETKPVSMNAQIGNLSVFYNLDLQQVKSDFGVPATDYVPARTTLQQFAETYNIPEDDVKAYFAKFYRYNGWLVLWNDPQLLPTIGRTVLITVLSVIGVNFLSFLTGYGLAGLARRDQRLIYGLYIINPLIPPMLVLLPQFFLIQEILRALPDNLNTFGRLAAIVLIHIKGGALPVMIFTGFISAVPKELEEAAQIDGASPLQYLFRVLLPLCKVPIATVTVIMLPWFWNDFLQPYVYLDSKNTTLLPLIQQFTGQYTTNYQVSFTGIFISIVPLIIVYILFRHWFIEGAMSGAIK
jgi:ABC-type glycerol-3-phosphate transport system permease component